MPNETVCFESGAVNHRIKSDLVSAALITTPLMRNVLQKRFISLEHRVWYDI